VAILGTNQALHKNSHCPGHYFIIFQNVKISGQIGSIEDIGKTLSELKWPLRATMFWEILNQLEDLGGISASADHPTDTYE